MDNSNPQKDIETRPLIQAESVGGAGGDGTLLQNIEIARQQRKKKILIGVGAGLLGIGVILAIVLPLVLRKHPEPPTPPKPKPPVDFYNPYVLDPKSVQVLPSKTTGIIKVVQQYSSEAHSEAFGRIISKLKDSPLKQGVNTTAIPVGLNNKLIRNLNFTFTQNTWRVSKLIITDADKPRYKIPEMALPNPGENLDMRLDMVGFNMPKTGAFEFSFSDPLIAGNKFIDTHNCSLVFMDKFIQMDFNLPSQNLFGFGERIREFALKEGAWNMWAHGQPSPYDDGSGRKGVYGVHPFLLIQGKRKDDFFGLYFRNSNAQTPIITYNDTTGGSKLSYITTGGQLEIYFFIHGSALDIIKKYQEVLGVRPKLPPFWSLGWMQASYKWSTQQMVEDVVGNYSAYNMPLDTVFLDIPYMDNYVDFTVNPVNFTNLPQFVKKLHDNKQQIIPIIDAGISAEDINNKYYKIGNTDDIFIKSGIHKSTKYNNNLINEVWPKIAVFVDWFNQKCTYMWFTGLRDLYEKLPYDGIWIDMNEPWGFQTAELNPNNLTDRPRTSEPRSRRRLLSNNVDLPPANYSWYKSFPQDKQSTWFLPFLPDYQNYKSYDNNTISLNATNPSINETQYNVHSFYGHMMAKRTSEYFLSRTQNKSDEWYDKRHFILTRSTYTTTGNYASHWLGDNYREYAFMNYSIAGSMNMNMFGIPHVGADIGGFFGNFTDPVLLTKWAQLGTYYPFARFHYDIDSPANEPYRLPEPYRSIVRRTMLDRYQYMRQLYTCMREVSNNGGTCFDPLFYYFPNDTMLYNEIESTFIFAGAIKVTPNIQNSTQQWIPAYFPEAKGKWVNLNNLREALNGSQTYQLDTTGYSTPAHLMPGKIIAFQNNSDGSIMNIHQLINGSITLLVNPDNENFGQGTLFLDQGEKVSELDNWEWESYNIQFSAKSIQFFTNGNLGGQDGYSLESVKILNGERFKDNDVACYLSRSKQMEPQPLVARWVEEENALRIFSENATSPLRFSDIHSIHFSLNSEFNICDQKHYQYKTEDGQAPDIDGKDSVQFKLVHVANVLPPINAQLSIYSGNILNLKWTYSDGSSTGKKMYKVPEEYVNPNNLQLKGDLSQFVRILPSPFRIQFLFNREYPTEFFGIDSLVYDDYLNWIRVHAVTEKDDEFRGIFGLGEKANFDFFLKDGVYSMWSRDIPTPIENAKPPGNNMYGTHPYFMYKHSTNAWIGILYNLAAAQDWYIKNDPQNGKVNIQTVAVGGQVDMYIMMGNTPDAVITKYNTLIGNPVLIPQWSLGWHQCRYGYRSTDVLKSVLAGYRNNSIPLDVMWSDIDYMKDYRNFIYDSDVAFKGLPQFIKDLHNQGMKYVPILDAGTAARPLPEDNYTAFIQGDKDGVFLKLNGQTFIGQVWPNDAAFPDFFNPTAIKWWQDNLSSMQGLLPFDGLWLDMNEVSNFCGGVCYKYQLPQKSVKSNLKYTPTGRDLELPNSLPLDTVHSNGDIQLDTHSLFGISEIKITHEWFQNSKKTRTFIIERSSYAGMGKWASRWLGDNFSEEKFMKLSVSGIMQMSMFGIPLSGSDICGFLGNTNEALCTKWHFVGAFYPFSRNHNGGTEPQEPYIFSKSAMQAMTNAIKLKYSMIRYYYTELFILSLRGTGTFYKPLFFEFPEDDEASKTDIQFNIMLGSALKLSINSESLTDDTTEFYFPAGWWCRISGNTGKENCFKSPAGGSTKVYPSGLTDYQLHLREGFIIPMQDTISKNFSTSADLQKQPVDLHIAGSPSEEGDGTWFAQGRYINDDGVVLNIANNYNSYTFYASYDSTSTITVRFGMDAKANNFFNQQTNCYFVNQNDNLGSISFYNAKNLGINNNYDVTVILAQGAQVKASTQQDIQNDKLVVSFATPICMSNIQKITFVKK